MKNNTMFPIKFWEDNFHETKLCSIILLSGKPQAGKTSLLMALGLPKEKILFEEMSFYLYHHSIVVEFTAQENISEWLRLLTYLKPWKNKITKLIHCLPITCDGLIDENELYFSNLQTAEFNRLYKKPTNVCMLFNQLDRIVGFDYFSKMLNAEQMKQLFCFTFSEKKSKKWACHLDMQLQQQAENIKAYCHSQLESQTCLKARQDLFVFPIAFMQLKLQLVQSIDKLKSQGFLLTNIKSILFSCMQNSNTEKCLFIHEFWPNVLCEIKTNKNKNKWKIRCYLAIIILLLSIFSPSLWHHGRNTIQNIAAQENNKKQLANDFYEARIAHRYPIDMQSNQDVEISDFNHFYGAHGLLNQLYPAESIAYLKIESDKNEFAPSKMYSKIKQAFFENNSENAKIDLSIKVNSFSENITQVELIVSGKSLIFTHDNQDYMPLTWSGTNQITALIWTDTNGRKYSNTTQDPWGFFRLLQKATIKTVGNDLLIIFQQSAFSVTFTVKNSTKVNPLTLFN